MKAKPNHLCSYGNIFAGEINQCQAEGHKWLEILPKVWVAYCETHYDKVDHARANKEAGSSSIY